MDRKFYAGQERIKRRTEPGRIGAPEENTGYIF